MKKNIETLLALICICAIVLGGCERPDGTCDLVLTFSCLAVVVCCALAFRKLNPEQKEGERYV